MDDERMERMKERGKVIQEASRLKRILDQKKDEESRKAFWDFVIKNNIGDNIFDDDL